MARAGWFVQAALLGMANGGVPKDPCPHGAFGHAAAHRPARTRAVVAARLSRGGHNPASSLPLAAVPQRKRATNHVPHSVCIQGLPRVWIPRGLRIHPEVATATPLRDLFENVGCTVEARLELYKHAALRNESKVRKTCSVRPNDNIRVHKGLSHVARVLGIKLAADLKRYACGVYVVETWRGMLSQLNNRT